MVTARSASGTVRPAISPRGQLATRIGANALEPVRDLSDAQCTLEVIKEQGEGTWTSPKAP